MTEWCENCQDFKPVEAEMCGIGPYEFWGQRCFDDTRQVICSECGEPVEMSYREFKSEMDAIRADMLYDEWKDEGRFR